MASTEAAVAACAASDAVTRCRSSTISCSVDSNLRVSVPWNARTDLSIDLIEAAVKVRIAESTWLVSSLRRASAIP